MENVYATDVTVSGTVADELYGYTGRDVMTAYNYRTYYEKVTGYLKNCGNYGYFVQDGSPDWGSQMATMIMSDFDNDMEYIGSCQFPNYAGTNFVLYSWWGSTYSVYTYTGSIVGGSDLAVVMNMICSTEPFDIYFTIYIEWLC